MRRIINENYYYLQINLCETPLNRPPYPDLIIPSEKANADLLAHLSFATNGGNGELAALLNGLMLTRGVCAKIGKKNAIPLSNGHENKAELNI